MTSLRVAPGRGTSAAAGRGRRYGATRRHRPAPARLLSGGSAWVMRLGLVIGLAVYALFGLVPAVANVVVSLTNYSGLAGSSTLIKYHSSEIRFYGIMSHAASRSKKSLLSFKNQHCPNLQLVGVFDKEGNKFYSLCVV